MEAPLVILASSHKHGGICLAGKLITPSAGQWVRPVSPRETGALPPSWLHRVAGTIPRVGMCLSVPLGRPVPEEHQQENHAIEAGLWTRIPQISTDKLTTLVDPDQPLWQDGGHSFRGHNDRIPESIVRATCRASLRLIKPAMLRFTLDHAPDKTGLRALFDHAGRHYALAVTDDVAIRYWKERLDQGHDGRADALLTISLGLPFNGFCYKLVAGVIELEKRH